MRYLLITLLTALLTLPGHSQSSKDSTLIPNSQLRIALSLIEQGKFCAEQLEMYKERSKLLDARVALRDTIIATYATMTSTNTAIIKNYQTEQANLLGQKELLNNAVKSLTKQLKVQKRKNIFTSVAGILGMSGLALLLLK